MAEVEYAQRNSETSIVLPIDTPDEQGDARPLLVERAIDALYRKLQQGLEASDVDDIRRMMSQSPILPPKFTSPPPATESPEPAGVAPYGDALPDPAESMLSALARMRAAQAWYDRFIRRPGGSLQRVTGIESLEARRVFAASMRRILEITRAQGDADGEVAEERSPAASEAVATAASSITAPEGPTASDRQLRNAGQNESRRIAKRQLRAREERIRRLRVLAQQEQVAGRVSEEERAAAEGTLQDLPDVVVTIRENPALAAPSDEWSSWRPQRSSDPNDRSHEAWPTSWHGGWEHTSWNSSGWRYRSDTWYYRDHEDSYHYDWWQNRFQQEAQRQTSRVYGHYNSPDAHLMSWRLTGAVAFLVVGDLLSSLFTIRVSLSCEGVVLLSFVRNVCACLWHLINAPREITVVQVGLLTLFLAAIMGVLYRSRSGPESQITRIRRGTDIAITTRVHRLTPVERARIITDEDGSQFLGQLYCRCCLKPPWVISCLVVFWLSIRFVLFYGDSGVSPEREDVGVFIISTDLSGLFQTQAELVRSALPAGYAPSFVCDLNYPAWAGVPVYCSCMTSSGTKLGSRVCFFPAVAQKEWCLQYVLMVKGYRFGSVTHELTERELRTSPLGVVRDGTTQMVISGCFSWTRTGYTLGLRKVVSCRGISWPEDVHYLLSPGEQPIYIHHQHVPAPCMLLLKDLARELALGIVTPLDLPVTPPGYDISFYRTRVYASSSASEKYQCGTHAFTVCSGPRGFGSEASFMEAVGDEDFGDARPCLSANIAQALVRCGELQEDVRRRPLPYLSLIHI